MSNDLFHEIFSMKLYSENNSYVSYVKLPEGITSYMFVFSSSGDWFQQTEWF